MKNHKVFFIFFLFCLWKLFVKVKGERDGRGIILNITTTAVSLPTNISSFFFNVNPFISISKEISQNSLD